MYTSQLTDSVVITQGLEQHQRQEHTHHLTLRPAFLFHDQVYSCLEGPLHADIPTQLLLPFHCLPRLDGSTLGIEQTYPF